MDNNLQDKEETFALVFDELDRMNRLVNNLILLAKAERFDFLKPETIELEPFAQELYRKITTLAQRNWSVEIENNGSFTGDRQRITQAVINLVQNAIHHTTEEEEILLGAKIEQEQVHLWVKDTGEGFSPEDKELILQRFGRGNSRRNYDGQGLGLSIVQAIVKAHGGDFTADGKLGEGAIFTIMLPIAQNP